MSIPVKVDLAVPGRKKWGFFRTLREARKNVLRLIPDQATKQAIITDRFFGTRWHMIMQPEAIGRVLKDRMHSYPKSNITRNLLEPAIGDSMFVAEGAHWRWQRRAAAPVFTHRNIANLAPLMCAATQETIARLSDCNGRADMFDEMVRTTFDVIASVTFSGSQEMDSGEVHKAIDEYIDQVARVSILDMMNAPRWIPRPGRVFRPNALLKMKSIADEAVAHRKLHGAKEVPDLLDLLMVGEDPKTKRKMNAAEIRDNILTFIVAGHETTALTLSWAFYLCAFDTDVQDKLRAEAQQVLNGRVATAQDCEKLIYTKQVINETLRLYPAGAFLSRTAQEEDTLCGQDIHKNETVILPIYAIHRNALLWDNPDHFDPDRFAPDKKIERYTFIPFADGPRICIGAQFAIIEAQIVLASLISQFKFEKINGVDPKPEMVLTLRPEGGVKLKVTPV
jgi:cytochrome P450